MKRVFVDTNVFLRFFTRDDVRQHKLARELFELAKKGDIKLVTGPPVMFELYWTLTTGYSLSSDEALDVVESIVSQPGISLIDQKMVESAVLKAKEADEEFPDAYICAAAGIEECDAIATFNVKDFENLGATLHSLSGD